MNEKTELTINEQPALSEWLTTVEAAKLSGYASVSIRRALHSGNLPGEKRGRDWFVRREDVLEYIRRMSELGTKKFTPRKYISKSED